MKKITIGVEQFPEELCGCLMQARDRLQEESGVVLQGERYTRGKYTFFTYRFRHAVDGQGDHITELAIHALAEGVAEYITEVWERHELAKIVANEFYYYAAEEVEYLAESAVQMLAELKDHDGVPLRRRHIVDGVVDLLRHSQELLVEGMLRFRMNVLQVDLHRVIEQAIDEYLMDLEYQEFVKLLRYFLQAQDPGIPLLHMVCLEEDAPVRLFDGEGKPLIMDELEGAKQQANLRECGVMIEETMSALISAAPQKVHIHLALGSSNPPPLVETVKKVFGEAAILCMNCPLCETARQWQATPNAADRKM